MNRHYALILLILMICVSLPELADGQRECAIIIQGWEKPKGYTDETIGGKPLKADETNITNSVDAFVRGFNNFPGGAKVTAIRPNDKMGATKGEGYKDKDELIKKLKKAICDSECDDIVLSFAGHGDLKSGAMAIAVVGSPKEYTMLHGSDVAEIVAECQKKVKLINTTCNSANFIMDFFRNLDKDDYKLVEVAMSACGSKQTAKASIGGAGWFTNNFLKDYYLIITNPNLMNEIQEEADRLKKEAQLKADEENKKIEEERNKQKEDQQQAEKEKLKKEREKAEAEEKAAEAKAAATISEIDNKKKKIAAINATSKTFNKYLNETLELIKNLPAEKRIIEISELINTLITKIEVINIKKNQLPKDNRQSNISKLVEKVLRISKDLPPHLKLKSLEKLKAALEKITKVTSSGYNSSETTARIHKHFKIIGEELSKIRKAIKEAKKESEKAANKTEETDSDDKNQLENDQNEDKDDKKELPKIKPKDTPSAMALILHYSFKSAHAKTKRQAKNQDPEEQVNPGPEKSNIKFPDDPPVSVWVSPPGLSFTFRKVMVKGKCFITGYVSNSKGVPISPIISKSCNKDCSKTEFKFKDVNGREKNGSITFVKEGNPIVKIGNESKEGTYNTIDVDIKRDIKEKNGKEKIGYVKIEIKGGETPAVKGYEVGGKMHNGRTGVKEVKYDPEKKILKFKINIAGEWIPIEIKFYPHDYRSVQVGSAKPYMDFMVMNYNLFDNSGNRVAYASFLQEDDHQVKGDIWISKGNRTISIDGSYLHEGPFITYSGNDDYSIFTNYRNGLSDVQWSHEKQLLEAQVLYPEPIIDLLQDAEIKYIKEESQVKIEWQLEETVYEKNSELVGFQIFRYDEANGDPQIFDLSKDQRAFSDTGVEKGKKYQYQFSVATQNNNIDDNYQSPRFPHYSRPVILEIEIEDDEEDEKKKPIVPLIVGGAGVIAGGIAILNKGEDPIKGCTDPTSCTYNPDATEDDGSCLYVDCSGECGGNILVGVPCNDGDECTVNDMINSNCECEGVFEDTDGDGICDFDDFCPELNNSLIGTACDDGDSCTTNDLYSPGCECEGIYTDSDSDGICDAEDQCPGFNDNLIGTSCDDGDLCTEGDIYNSNCECEGIYTDSDGDGICDAEDNCPELDNSLIGTSCDDGNDCTELDTWLVTCECSGTFIDSDNDGVCDANDQCPGFDDGLIGTACDDANDCTINDIYTSTCQCEGTPIDSDGDGVCDADDQCPGFDDNLIGTTCDDGDPCTLNDSYTSDCECAGVFSDLDNDGICDVEDVCPGFDDNLIGTGCNDSDDCTVNDIYQTDCTCAGTFQDSDGDGVCDAEDQCPGQNDGLIGNPCDDGDDCTVNDQFNNNCQCEGTFQDSDNDGVCDFDDQCPGFDDSLIGTSCDDGDDCTSFDIYLPSCNCVGAFQDADGDGICDADDQCPGLDDNLIGTNCNDGDDCTVNDIYQPDCGCSGTFQDSDGDGVCDVEDQCPGLDDNLIGAGCDDGDDCTINDTYQPDCNCVGTFQDSDGDGTCDAEDQCPGFDNNMIGEPCDDGNDCTINDMIGILCNCGGTLQDEDNDGICDADDICPGFDDNLIGQPCNDGNNCTINDVWTSNCNCEGTLQVYNANIETTDTFCELDNGAATVTMTPSGSYQFFWDLVPGTDTQLELSPGVHQLEALDLNTGCSTIYTFNIDQGTMPDLFVVTNLVPDPGDGTGMIVIELNNVYNGPYQVCWNGQTVGGNGCQFPLTNGPFAIMGVSDFYNIQVQIFNGAPVPCIHQELIPIPEAAHSQESGLLHRVALGYSNAVQTYSTFQSSERLAHKPSTQIYNQGGIQLLYIINEHYRTGIQFTSYIYQSLQPRANYFGPVIKWTPWRDDKLIKKPTKKRIK